MTTIKRNVAPCINVINIYACKFFGTGERPQSDARYAVWNRDTRQVGAIRERPSADGDDGITYRYTRKIGAIFKRLIADGGNFVAINITANEKIGIGTSTNTCNGTSFAIIIHRIGKTLT